MNISAVISRAVSAAAAAAVGCALVVIPGSPARALGVDVLCEGTFTVGFTPALTDKPQGTITNREFYSYATCETGLPGMSRTTDQQPGETCVDLFSPLTPYNEVITWEDLGTSTVHWTSIEATTDAATYTGTVTSGRYSGDGATKVVAGLTFSGTEPLLCPVGEGTISSVSGTTTLTLTSG